MSPLDHQVEWMEFYIVNIHTRCNSTLQALPRWIITPVYLVLFVFVAGADTPILDKFCIETFFIYMRLVFINATLRFVHEVSRCVGINSRIPLTILESEIF